MKNKVDSMSKIGGYASYNVEKRKMKNKVDSISKIGGYASYNVGFQKNIYEKAKSENKRTDKKLVEKYGAAQKTASKQPELS